MQAQVQALVERINDGEFVNDGETDPKFVTEALATVGLNRHPKRDRAYVIASREAQNLPAIQKQHTILMWLVDLREIM